MYTGRTYIYTYEKILRKIHVELEPIETNVAHLFTLIFTWGVNRFRENVLKQFCCIQIFVAKNDLPEPYYTSQHCILICSIF